MKTALLILLLCVDCFAAEVNFSITPNPANPPGTTHFIFGHTNSLAATNLTSAFFKHDLGTNQTARASFTNGTLYFRAVAITPEGAASLPTAESVVRLALPPGMLVTVSITFTNGP